MVRSRALRSLFRGFESLERRDLLASVPLAFDDPQYATAINTDLVISTTAAGIVSNDIDVDSSSLSASIVDNPAHGSLLSFNGNGTFTYRPNTGFSGFDSFTYQVSDGVNDSNTATVTIAVGGAFGPRTNRDADVHSNLLHDGNVTLAQPLSAGNSLVYRSDSVAAAPIVVVETSLLASASVPDSIDAQLTFDSITGGTVSYDTTGLSAGDPLRFVLQADASSLATGYYDYTVTLKAWYGATYTTTTFSGSQAVVNRSESEFGTGWWFAGLDQLVVSGSGALLVSSSGDTTWYADDGSGGFLPAEGDLRFATLVENGGGDFTLTAKTGETWNFSSIGLLTSVVDTNGNTYDFAYTDGDGDSVSDELSQITDPFGRESYLTYSGGLAETWEDFAGRITSLDYTSGQLTTVTQPEPDGGGALAAPETDYAYDATTALLTSVTDPLSHATSFAYDANTLRLSTITFADSNTRSLEPVLTAGWASGSGNSLAAPADAIGVLTDERDEDWTVTTDRFGNVLTSTDPLGNTTTIQYDQRGLPYRITQPDPDGAGSQTSPVTLLGYNEFGDNVLIVYPGGATATRTYDATFHRVLTSTDELNRTWTYTLDAYGNVAAAEDPAGNTWTITYDAGGRTASVTSPDPDGAGPLSAAVTEFEYDAYGRLITQTNADATTRTYTYNSADQVTSVTDELLRETLLTWDALGRRTSVTDPAGAETTYAYNAAGLLVSQTDPLGAVTEYAYTDRNWLDTVTYPDPDGAGPLDSSTSTYGYDAAGNKISEGQPSLGPSTQILYDYDDAGRLWRRRGPLSLQTTTYTLDNLGRITQEADPLGNSTTYAYNARGWVTSVTQADPDSSGPLAAPVTQFQYDAAGQRTAIIDPLGHATTIAYDVRGLTTLVTLADPDGSGPMYSSSIGYEYDAAGRLSKVTDALWRATVFTYDSVDRLTTMTQEGPECTYLVTNYEYDAAGQVVNVTDPLGRESTYEYDDVGRVLSVTLPDPDGAGAQASPVYEYTYNLAGSLLSSTDPLEQTTTYTYDALQRRASVTLPDPDGAGGLSAPVTTYVYGSQAAIDTITDALGHDVTFSYDNAGRQTQVADHEGNVTTFAYDLANRLTSVTLPDPDGGGSQTSPVTSYSYDALNRLTTIADASSGETHFHYDAASNLVSLLDPVGNETSWAYDALNRVTMETNELSATRSFYYDGANNLTRRIDRNGRTLQFAYDELNRQISEQWREDAAPAPEIAIATTTQGGATAEVQRVGFTAMMITGGTFTLTHSGQTTSNLAWNASAADVKSALEALSGVGSGNVAVTKLSNATNRQEWQVTFQGSLSGTNVAQTTVATGALTTMGGGPTAIQATDTQGGTNDEVQTVTLSHATDGVFRLAFGGQVTPPLDFAATAGDVETALEDLATVDAVSVTGSAGGPWTVTFQGTHAGLNVASLQGDTANLLGGDSVRTISYVYDDAGQLTSVADPDSAYAYTYDALGRVIEVDNDGTPDAPHVVLAMTYDAASRRTGLSATVDATADFVNTYTYDHLGRLIRVDQLGQTGGNSVAAKRVDFTYNALGQFTSITRQTKPSSTWNEVATSTYTYDTLNRLTALDHTHGATDLNNYTWTYDDLDSSWDVTSSVVGGVSSNPIVSALATGAIFMGGGRIVEMTSVDGTSTYTYDETSQLTGADHDYQSDESYSYDANGNRTMSGYDTGDNNQLLEDGTYLYEYDDEGNRTSRTNLTTDESTEYEWDYRNRLTRVTDKDAYGATTQVVAYTYDVFNRRIGRAVDTTSPFDLEDAAIERYILDDANGVMSLDGGNVILDFVDPDGPEGAADLSLAKRYLYGSAVDQILAQEDVTESLGGDARVLWPLGDHLQTTRDVVDQTGTIVEHYEYDSYGNVTAGDTSVTRYLFTAREFDEVTGLQYNRARWYDAGVGRWLAEDPLGFAAGDANVFAYVQNAVTTVIDPSGLEGILSNFWENVYAPCLTGFVTAPITLLKHGNVVGQAYMLYQGEHPTQVAYNTIATHGIVHGTGKLTSDIVHATAEKTSVYQWTTGNYIRYRGVFPQSEEDKIRSQQMHARYGAAWGEAGIFLIGSYLPRIMPARFGLGAPPTTPRSVPQPIRGGLGNIGNHGPVSPDVALTSATKWLGQGYKEIAPGVYRSADGLRQFRMTNADLIPTHGNIGPHVHFEALDAARKVIENLHIPVTP